MNKKIYLLTEKKTIKNALIKLNTIRDVSRLILFVENEE